jgi:pyruvate kinase
VSSTGSERTSASFALVLEGSIRRRTKIVATIGPATDAPETLEALIEAGMDCARLNCSHGTQADLRRRAVAVRGAAAKLGRPVGLLFDLQGPKLRLAGDTPERHIGTGDEVSIGGTDPGALTVDFEDFEALVSERSQIVIGDGLPRFDVVSVTEGVISVRAVMPGTIGPRKGVNVTYAHPGLPALTPKDLADLEVAVELDADFVALSFVRSAADVELLQSELDRHGSHARTIAKIEKIEAYENLDAILTVSKGVMVARGDYGVEAGVARVPLMQKDTINRATQMGKTVITATQMLESMIHAPEPTRAEVADVANAVIDGTSAVMLSAETGVGEYPLESVRVMDLIALAAEESPEILGKCRDDTGDSPAAAILHSAVELAERIGAAAIVVPTTTGGGARACAKYRPARPVVAFTADERVLRQLNLEWGIYPRLTVVHDSVEAMEEDALKRTLAMGGFAVGEHVVLTAGMHVGAPGSTNLLMVREL